MPPRLIRILYMNERDSMAPRVGRPSFIAADGFTNGPSPGNPMPATTQALGRLADALGRLADVLGWLAVPVRFPMYARQGVVATRDSLLAQLQVPQGGRCRHFHPPSCLFRLLFAHMDGARPVPSGRIPRQKRGWGEA